MAGKCKYCGFVGTQDEIVDHAGEMCQGDCQPDTVEETRHIHQQPQHKICPDCGGTGQDDPPPGKYHGLCSTCGGSGKLRAGAA